MELVDGAFWRPFWWYDSTGGWPTDATDTLGGNVLDLLYSCIVKSKIVFEFQIFNIACERTIYIKYNDITLNSMNDDTKLVIHCFNIFSFKGIQPRELYKI